MPTMQACHCSMCRTWSGGPFMATPCKPAKFNGSVAVYQSSDGIERGFCSTCGTHLFFHHKRARIHAIPIGLFEDQTGLPFRAEIYTDMKPDYYSFADETKKMTGAEFEAKFR